ncbi:hypothetical protein HDU76_007050 [Blyttiomyces sp. JEL0837]|nr:hypothetical protein HDU76_007050 [Blyttiomyces sp. JEL0837]
MVHGASASTPISVPNAAAAGFAHGQSLPQQQTQGLHGNNGGGSLPSIPSNSSIYGSMNSVGGSGVMGAMSSSNVHIELMERKEDVLMLRMVYSVPGKQSQDIKFPFNLHDDTATDVVAEMVKESLIEGRDEQLARRRLEEKVKGILLGKIDLFPLRKLSDRDIAGNIVTSPVGSNPMSPAGSGVAVGGGGIGASVGLGGASTATGTEEARGLSPERHSSYPGPHVQPNVTVTTTGGSALSVGISGGSPSVSASGSASSSVDGSAVSGNSSTMPRSRQASTEPPQQQKFNTVPRSMGASGPMNIGASGGVSSGGMASSPQSTMRVIGMPLAQTQGQQQQQQQQQPPNPRADGLGSTSPQLLRKGSSPASVPLPGQIQGQPGQPGSQGQQNQPRPTMQVSGQSSGQGLGVPVITSRPTTPVNGVVGGPGVPTRSGSMPMEEIRQQGSSSMVQAHLYHAAASAASASSSVGSGAGSAPPSAGGYGGSQAPSSDAGSVKSDNSPHGLVPGQGQGNTVPTLSLGPGNVHQNSPPIVPISSSASEGYKRGVSGSSFASEYSTSGHSVDWAASHAGDSLTPQSHAPPHYPQGQGGHGQQLPQVQGSQQQQQRAPGSAAAQQGSQQQHHVSHQHPQHYHQHSMSYPQPTAGAQQQQQQQQQHLRQNSQTISTSTSTQTSSAGTPTTLLGHPEWVHMREAMSGAGMPSHHYHHQASTSTNAHHPPSLHLPTAWSPPSDHGHGQPGPWGNAPDTPERTPSAMSASSSSSITSSATSASTSTQSVVSQQPQHQGQAQAQGQQQQPPPLVMPVPVPIATAVAGLNLSSNASTAAASVQQKLLELQERSLKDLGVKPIIGGLPVSANGAVPLMTLQQQQQQLRNGTAAAAAAGGQKPGTGNAGGGNGVQVVSVTPGMVVTGAASGVGAGRPPVPAGSVSTSGGGTGAGASGQSQSQSQSQGTSQSSQQGQQGQQGQQQQQGSLLKPMVPTAGQQTSAGGQTTLKYPQVGQQGQGQQGQQQQAQQGNGGQQQPPMTARPAQLSVPGVQQSGSGPHSTGSSAPASSVGSSSSDVDDWLK